MQTVSKSDNSAWIAEIANYLISIPPVTPNSISAGTTSYVAGATRAPVLKSLYNQI